MHEKQTGFANDDRWSWLGTGRAESDVGGQKRQELIGIFGEPYALSDCNCRWDRGFGSI